MKKFSVILTALAVLFAASFCSADGVKISEFMAKNETTLATAGGTYEDWVEIHNDSGGAVDLAGWYLTDDITDLRKWQFPSTGKTSPLADNGYLIVFVDDAPDSVVGDELHADFKLGSGGEYLALIEPDGETVAYQYNPEYPDQSADVSYGIDAGTGEHAYFEVPTPGTANGQAIADTVQFSAKSHAFTSSFSLTLSVASPTAEIRYTLDGSLPTAASDFYGASIPISGTTRVRAQTFDAGLTDGAIQSQTYIHLDESTASFSSELPLVILENFNAGWMPHSEDGPERQLCEVAIFEPVAGICSLTNYPVSTSRAGIRRRGESTGNQPKPNLSLETWGEIDEDSRSIKPFGMPAESDWILYAPYSIDTALIRNPFIYEVSNETGNYAVRTQFVEVFLNHDGGSVSASDYYGVYVFMEKIKVGSGRVDVAELDETMDSDPDIAGGYLWKKDKADSTNAIDNFTAAGVPMPTKLGDRVLQYVSPSGEDMPEVQRNWLPNHINAIDSLVPYGNYESMIDVTAFVDHHILNVFANNADGLSVSTFYHKDRNGLVKMGPIWDFDRSMGCDNDDRASDPETWGTASDGLVFFHNGGRLWFDSLSREPEFWIVWVDRWQAMRNGPLSDAAMVARIEEYRTEISSAAERNFTRWPNLLKTNAWSDATTWSGKVDGMMNHVLTRGQWIDDQLVDPPVFNQDGGLIASGFQLTMTGPESKYYTLDASDPRASGGNPAGSTYGSPITITENTLVKARAWNGQDFTRAPAVWPWSPLSEAMFVVEPAPLAITEIMYHPRPPAGPSELGFSAFDFEFIEVKNTGSSTCDLLGVKLLDGVEFDFSYATSDSLAAEAHGVVVRNIAAFKARYPGWAGMNVLGVFAGRLDDSTEKIELGYDVASMPRLAAFDYEDDWYPSTDGEGFSLVLKDAASAASTWDGKTAWRHSAAVDGSPGASDPVPAYVPGAIVINEVLSHQDADNPGDWIELRNTTDGWINIGGWFLSDSRGNLKKFVIPAGVWVPANEYVVFNEHDHFGSAFALSEHGDEVYLSAGNGTALAEPAYRESTRFGGQERGVTFGRHVRADGSTVFVAQASPTMGAANTGPKVGPVVIEEIMYNPPFGGHEYLVLRNTSASTVDLFDPSNPLNVWKISGINFTFPLGVQLDAGESALLVRDTVSALVFRTMHQIPAITQLFSYSVALDNDADTITLKKSGSPEQGTGYVPYIVVDEVKYNDSAPWPLEADGAGRSLGRIDSEAHGDDVANWEPITATYAPSLFSLIVNGGTGGGIYSAGDAVRLAASNPSFARWIGNVAAVNNVLMPTTTLTMPADDTVISTLNSEPVSFIERDAVWKYDDQGIDLGSTWMASVYNDAGWAAGAAQLGYRDAGTVTTISYGGDADNKQPTTYFRHTFFVANPSAIDGLILELLRDDGAVVYLNGEELLRDNMPAGEIEYGTFASSTVGGTSEDTFYIFNVSASNLVVGDNVLAVEIHQREPDSSDLSFAASLKGTLVMDEAALDGDMDGMWDGWESDHFGSTENARPDIDWDADGCQNSAEFIAGTLPTDSNSYFRIESMTDGEIYWTAVPGRLYTVYWTDDLQHPLLPMTGRVPGGTYTLYPTNAAGFYQIKVEME